MGTRGTVETRHKEAQAAAKILGVSLRDNVGLPDSGLAVNQNQKLAVAEHIRRLRPHTVILAVLGGTASGSLHRRKIGLRSVLPCGPEATSDRGRAVPSIQSDVHHVRSSDAPDICGGYHKRICAQTESRADIPVTVSAVEESFE